MLDRLSSQDVQATPTETVRGHDLLIKLHHLAPRQRARLAKDLVSGNVQLANLTRRQAATIAAVSLPLVNEAVRGELTQPRRRINTVAVTAWWREAPLCERVELVRSFGAADTWDALAAVVA